MIPLSAFLFYYRNRWVIPPPASLDSETHHIPGNTMLWQPITPGHYAQPGPSGSTFMTAAPYNGTPIAQRAEDVNRPSTPNAAEQDSSRSKKRASNWGDAETRYLISVWKNHYPVSKRHNSKEWASIAKELNAMLQAQGLNGYRSGEQCKARMNNLEYEYKKCKDHNNKSGNDPGHEAFPYFEDLDELLGCRPKITPKHLEECGLPDKSSSSNDNSLVDPDEPTDDELREAERLFGIKNSGRDNKRKAKSSASNKASGAKKAKLTEESTTDFIKYLGESQRADHEFLEKLADKEGERELKSQQMMMNMLKDVAKIFKGDD